jgi:hypothetical protein
MPVQAPPARSGSGDFHFHVYDYGDSAPFKLSPGQPARQKQRFYSLSQDLGALSAYGQSVGVPNIRLHSGGKPLAYSDTSRAKLSTMVLSFGKSDAPAVLITGGIHAREWIAHEVTYLIAEYLIRGYGQPPSDSQARIRALVNSRQIHIAPMLNPVGNSYTVFTPGAARNWRKNRVPLPASKDAWLKLITHQQPRTQASVANTPFSNVRYDSVLEMLDYTVPVYRRPGELAPGEVEGDLADGQYGVDLDRNFPTTTWGHETRRASQDEYMNQRLPASDVYFGPRALSEAEAATVAEYAAKLPAARLVAIDYHSYGRFILFPGETTDAGWLDPADRWLGTVMQLLTDSPYGPPYELGTPSERVGYSATGTIDSYLVQALHARAYTIELDGPDFSIPDTEIQKVFETSIRGVLAAIAAGHQDETAMTAALQEFSRWRVYGRGNRLPAG